MQKIAPVLALILALSGCAVAPTPTHPSRSAPSPQTPSASAEQPASGTDSVSVPSVPSDTSDSVSSPGTVPVDPAVPSPSRYYLDDGPPDISGTDLAAIPDAVPRREPLAPGRDKPYRALGQTFRPHKTHQPHRERGVASWYGKRYHGRPTASGEIYDMFKMTAAHPVLPLPSYARVTRTDNGASIVVRVNDRGPFLRGRVIDLSFAAATKLGVVQAGSAEVVVEAILPKDIPPDSGAGENESETNPRAFFIQLGAFSRGDGAKKTLAEFRASAPEHLRESGVVFFHPRKKLHYFGAGNYPDADAARDDMRMLCDIGWCGFVAPVPE